MTDPYRQQPETLPHYRVISFFDMGSFEKLLNELYGLGYTLIKFQKVFEHTNNYECNRFTAIMELKVE